MTKQILTVLFAVTTLSSVSHADDWSNMFTTLATTSPQITSQMTTDDARAHDRKIMVERIANDALLNIETGEQTELLKSVFETLRSERPELRNATDKQISKRLIEEAIHNNSTK